MSVRAARTWLWLGALLLVPLPMLALDAALVPVVRFLLLGGACVAVLLVEGGGGVTESIAALLLVHTAVYAGLLWAAAWLIARSLARLSGSARRALVLGILGLALLLALTTEPYRTPFGHAARGGLLDVLR